MAPPALSASDFHSGKETLRARAERQKIDSADSDADSDAAIPDAAGELEMDCDADGCGGADGWGLCAIGCG